MKKHSLHTVWYDLQFQASADIHGDLEICAPRIKGDYCTTVCLTIRLLGGIIVFPILDYYR